MDSIKSASIPLSIKRWEKEKQDKDQASLECSGQLSLFMVASQWTCDALKKNLNYLNKHTNWSLNPEFFYLHLQFYLLNNYNDLKETNVNNFLNFCSCFRESNSVLNPWGFSWVLFFYLISSFPSRRGCLWRGYAGIRRLAEQFTIFVTLNSLWTKILLTNNINCEVSWLSSGFLHHVLWECLETYFILPFS